MQRSTAFILAFTVVLMVAACAAPPAAPTATITVPVVTQIVTLPPRPTKALVSAADHVLGPDNAFLTIIHYGDFHAEPCVSIARTLLILQQRYPADVRVVWRPFPSADERAQLAAQTAEAAAAQGKFWPMHDQLLADQASWRNLPLPDARAKMIDYARLIALPDLARFEAALDSQEFAAPLAQAVRDAQQRGFKSAPVLTFRDELYEGRIDEYALDNLTRLLLLEKRQYDKAPALQIDPQKSYSATLVTEKGNVRIELFTRDAPVAVNNFVFLARQGWYNDITFHLITPEITQTGDPSGTGLGTAGYSIIDESDNGLIFDREGLVAMSIQRGKDNSASSQFFITYGPLPPEGFNGQYTIFGRVTEGMDVLRRLTPRNPFDELRFPNPPPGDKLIRVEISEGQ